MTATVCALLLCLGGGFNLPEKRVRPADQDQDVPFYKKPEFDCLVTSVRFPLTTKPEQWTHKENIETAFLGGLTIERSRSETVPSVRCGARGWNSPSCPQSRRAAIALASRDLTIAWLGSLMTLIAGGGQRRSADQFLQHMRLTGLRIG